MIVMKDEKVVKNLFTFNMKKMTNEIIFIFFNFGGVYIYIYKNHKLVIWWLADFKKYLNQIANEISFAIVCYAKVI